MADTSRIPVLEAKCDVQSAEGFREVYLNTHVALFRYLYASSNASQPMVEDWTAETYFRAWRTRHNFEGDLGAALRWLFTIGRRLMIDSYRHSNQVTPTTDLEKFDLATPQPSPEEQTLLNEQHEHLRRVMQRLPDNQRQMLILRYILGWKVKDIAAYLDMNENTVSVNIKRALTRLRDEWSTVE